MVSIREGGYSNSWSSPEIFHQKHCRYQASSLLGTAEKAKTLFLTKETGTVYDYLYPAYSGLTSSQYWRGWHYIIKKTIIDNTAPTMVQKPAYASFTMHEPCLFNIIPLSIRNLKDCSVDHMKTPLDKFLATIPDKPQIHGYTAQRRAATNCLLDMVQTRNGLHR